MEAKRPDIMYLSTTDYIQHKYAPGDEGRQRLLPHDGWLSRPARRDGRRDRAHRRSRHERQAWRRRQAADPVPAGPCWTIGWGRARRGSSCRSPILMWCIMARSVRSPQPICRKAATRRPSPSGSQAGRHRAGADRATGCKKFELPEDRVGDMIVVSRKEFAIGTSGATPRSLRPRRAAALPWRHVRAEGAAHCQSQLSALPPALSRCAISAPSISA